MFCTMCNYMINVKNKWKDWCQDTDYLFPGQEDWFLYIWHKIAIHIFSVVTHDLTVSMHTLLPFPCHMIWRKYDAYVKPVMLSKPRS